MFWKQRWTLPPEEASSGYRVVFGDPLIHAVAGIGGLGARIALTTIERLDDGELGIRAGALAAGLGGEDGALPNWVTDLGGG